MRERVKCASCATSGVVEVGGPLDFVGRFAHPRTEEEDAAMLEMPVAQELPRGGLTEIQGRPVGAAPGPIARRGVGGAPSRGPSAAPEDPPPAQAALPGHGRLRELRRRRRRREGAACHAACPPSPVDHRQRLSVILHCRSPYEGGCVQSQPAHCPTLGRNPN